VVGQLTADASLDIVAGLLILAVGAFVLVAKPHSGLHRLFFAFAAVDGLSTLAFEWRAWASDPAVAAWAMWSYFGLFIAFLTLLLILSVQFPLPLLGRSSAQRTLVVALAAIGAGMVAWHSVDYRFFWTAQALAGGGIRVTHTPLGLGFIAVFAAAGGWLSARCIWILQHEPSATHRRQAILFLSGLMLAFAPFATIYLAEAMRKLPAGWADNPLRQVVFILAYGATTLAVLLVGALALTRRIQTDHIERRALLGSVGAVFALTAIVVIWPGLAASMQVLALLAYPLLLAFAIVRYGVLDIDARLARASALTLIAAAFAAAFLVLEETIEGLLSSAVGSSLLAAVIAAALAYPLARATYKAISRLRPDDDAERLERRLEIYAHTLRGTLRDGKIDATESAALRALRETLGISHAQHDEAYAHLTQTAGAHAADDGAGRPVRES